MDDKDVCVWRWDARLKHWQTACGKYELESPGSRNYRCLFCQRRINILREPKEGEK